LVKAFKRYKKKYALASLFWSTRYVNISKGHKLKNGPVLASPVVTVILNVYSGSFKDSNYFRYCPRKSMDFTDYKKSVKLERVIIK